MTNQCSGTTANGAPCKAKVKNGDYCWRHVIRDESESEPECENDIYYDSEPDRGLAYDCIESYLDEVKSSMHDVTCDLQVTGNGFQGEFTITGKGDVRELAMHLGRIGFGK